MSIYIGIVASALINAVFIGFYIKTGIDASPSGIGLTVIQALAPYLPTTSLTSVELLKFLLVAMPWIVTVIGILKANNKLAGLVLYCVVFVIMVSIVSYI